MLDIRQALDQVTATLKSDPLAAQPMADSVVELAKGYGPKIQAEAHIKQGAARRHVADWDGAEVAYFNACQSLRECGAAGMDWLDWLQGLAVLKMDRRHLRMATDLAKEAVSLCRPDHWRLGRTQAVLGVVLRQTDLQKAEAVAREALGRIPPSDRCYYRTAVSVIVASLLYQRKDTDVDGWLATLRGYNDPPESYPWLKLRWFEGLRAGRFRELATAIKAMTEAYTGLAKIHGGEAAVCALDLAEIFVYWNRLDRAQELAGKLAPVFEALGTNAEAVAALKIYTDAARVGFCLEHAVKAARHGILRVPIAPVLGRR